MISAGFYLTVSVGVMSVILTFILDFGVRARKDNISFQSKTDDVISTPPTARQTIDSICLDGEAKPEHCLTHSTTILPG